MLDPHLMLVTLAHEERQAEAARHRAARAVVDRRRAACRAAILDAAPSRAVAQTV